MYVVCAIMCSSGRKASWLLCSGYLEMLGAWLLSMCQIFVVNTSSGVGWPFMGIVGDILLAIFMYRRKLTANSANSFLFFWTYDSRI